MLQKLINQIDELLSSCNVLFVSTRNLHLQIAFHFEALLMYSTPYIRLRKIIFL